MYIRDRCDDRPVRMLSSVSRYGIKSSLFQTQYISDTCLLVLPYNLLDTSLLILCLGEAAML